jgi:hypothetical protein
MLYSSSIVQTTWQAQPATRRPTPVIHNGSRVLKWSITTQQDILSLAGTARVGKHVFQRWNPYKSIDYTGNESVKRVGTENSSHLPMEQWLGFMFQTPDLSHRPVLSVKRSKEDVIVLTRGDGKPINLRRMSTRTRLISTTSNYRDGLTSYVKSHAGLVSLHHTSHDFSPREDRSTCYYCTNPSSHHTLSLHDCWK